MTVHEISELTGVSIRTLQYYDRIGLLKPAAYSPAGYRLYDEASLETLQQILLFRELEFPLREIRAVLCDPGFDRHAALEAQIRLLTKKKERTERLIALARAQLKGESAMDFSAFDKKAYEEEARKRWGQTAAYREFEAKTANRSEAQEDALGAAFLRPFSELGALRGQNPGAGAVQTKVKELQQFITAHYYTCTDDILRGLGQLYAADSAFQARIDAAGGAGTAAFAAEAIAVYCGK